MIKRSITFMTLALALTTLCQAQSRKVINLPSWDFSRDGKAWQQVAVPHDWAISGPFDKKWDLQMVAIEQNGEKEKRSDSSVFLSVMFFTSLALVNTPSSPSS